MCCLVGYVSVWGCGGQILWLSGEAVGETVVLGRELDHMHSYGNVGGWEEVESVRSREREPEKEGQREERLKRNIR